MTARRSPSDRELFTRALTDPEAFGAVFERDARLVHGAMRSCQNVARSGRHSWRRIAGAG